VGMTCAVVIASCEWPSTSITAGSFEEATYASRRTFEARRHSALEVQQHNVGVSVVAS
jgi:hypothetical protein